MANKFPYKWYLKNGYPASGVTKNNYKVFSCFACGGGSTMGYKLAGYDVIGFNEIDPKMAEVYKLNHNPKYGFIEPVQDFKLRSDLPKELYDLDILDGSPPCSSFSMAGNRDKDWGKEKKFREGQSEQVLDTLFFDFIELAEKLKPKVIIAENVKGLLLGAAKKYVKQIYKDFDRAGYYVEKWLLNASIMGVPQRRERVFFLALRKDLAPKIPGQRLDLINLLPYIDMNFKEKEINYIDIKTDIGRKASNLYYERWKSRKNTDTSFGDITARLNGSGSCFSDVFAHNNKPLPTITSGGGTYDFDTGHHISDNTYKKCGSYPLDYNFNGKTPAYFVGMSVPPIMTAQISTRIKDYWLDKII